MQKEVGEENVMHHKNNVQKAKVGQANLQGDNIFMYFIYHIYTSISVNYDYNIVLSLLTPLYLFP